MVDIYYYKSKPIECATSSMNSNANYRFGVIIRIGLLILTNVPLRCGMLIMEEAMPL